MTKKSFEERVIGSAIRTWDVIGGDCLVDENGYPDESVTLKRETVCEIVSDADYMQTHGDLSIEDMCRFYNDLSWDERRALMRKAFTYETYGW